MSMPASGGPPRILGNQWVQVIARTTIGGDALRLRFSNLFGRAPLLVRDVTVLCAPGESVVVPEQGEPVVFSGSRAIAIGPGTSIHSDGVPVSTRPEESVFITFLVESSPGPVTGHRSFGPLHGSTRMTDGNGEERFGPTFAGSLFLTAIDVLATCDGAVVALGDSITEGALAETAYSEVLARRLRQDPSSTHLSIVNAGVGGDALRGVIGQRLQHDVIEMSGVVAAILLIGTNDIGGGQARLAVPPTRQLVDGIVRLVDELRQAELVVWLSPITPFGDRYRPALLVPHYSEPDRVSVRHSVNNWIRGSAHFDERLDFDQALADPTCPDQIPRELSEDNLHPSSQGQAHMANSIDLAVFDGLRSE